MPPRFFAAPPPFSPGSESSGSGAPALDAAKAQLRLRARATRLGLKGAVPDAATWAAALAPLDILLSARPCVVAVYHPVGAELDPGPLAARLGLEGAVVASPVVVARNAPLIFRLQTDAEPVPDALGIMAPPPEAPEVRPDVVIVPLLAFDPTGARLGQGGGYYDRTLAQLRAQGAVLAVGLAYAGQAVAHIPVDGFDQRLDGVLTETAYLDFS